MSWLSPSPKVPETMVSRLTARAEKRCVPVTPVKMCTSEELHPRTSIWEGALLGRYWCASSLFVKWKIFFLFEYFIKNSFVCFKQKKILFACALLKLCLEMLFWTRGLKEHGPFLFSFLSRRSLPMSPLPPNGLQGKTWGLCRPSPTSFKRYTQYLKL